MSGLLAEECQVRIGGHEWCEADDTDEAPTSYCLACGMQGRDFVLVREMRKRLEALETEARNATLWIAAMAQQNGGAVHVMKHELVRLPADATVTRVDSEVMVTFRVARPRPRGDAP